MFSRVQHHFHEKTKQGYRPLAVCKSKRYTDRCKHDFPMDQRLTEKVRVVCRGNAARFGLRIQGKRNWLGKTLGRRTCEWQTGTSMALAVFSRSNSHTEPNYRLPPIACVHDADCPKECFSRPGEQKIICKLAQRAQREATGYYCGYTFKRQPVGRYVLKATAASLNYVELGLQDKSAGRQRYKSCNRMLTDLNHRCTMRTAPEELNLSANQHEQDATTAVFIRSYRTKNFPGAELLQVLEAEERGEAKRICRGRLPVRKAPVKSEELKAHHIEEVYGYRGRDPRVYYLSPWEFVMFWEVEELQPPRSGEVKDGADALDAVDRHQGRGGSMAGGRDALRRQ